MIIPPDISQQTLWEDRLLTAIWRPGLMPDTVAITQVSALCFTEAGQLVLVAEKPEGWSLPGGHPEAKETPEETLAREVREEACATVNSVVYLGAQEVQDPALTAPYYQLRYAVLVTLHPFLPAFETRYRHLVPPDRFADTLPWGQTPIAQALLSTALAIARERQWLPTGTTIM